MVAPDGVISMGQIELNCVLMLNRVVWNRTAFVFKTELFEKELFICMKTDLALINLQWLMCHKTQPNQTNQTLNVAIFGS